MTTGSTRARRNPSPPTGDERRAAILRTAEELLASRPLREISIDELARGAGISRPTFYFYFASKNEVLLTLLADVIADADMAVERAIGSLAADPAAALRRGLTGVFHAFGGRRGVTLAITEGYAAGGTVHARWTEAMGHWVDMTASAIDGERQRGAAPPGIPARHLAVLLNAMNERVLTDTFASPGGGVLGIAEDSVVDCLVAAWLQLIYAGRAGQVETSG